MSAHPPHWRSYAGAANWYRLWHPPSWEVSEDGGGACFTISEDGATLGVRTVWLHDSETASLESLAFAQLKSAPRRRMRPLRTPELPYEAIALEGETVLTPQTRWWQRIFAHWRRWRLWAIRRQPLCLVAVYLPACAGDPELDSVVGMVLNTLRFAERPADPPEVFVVRALELARKRFPLLQSRQSAGFQLQLGESQLNLANFYRAYTHDPDRFEQILLPALTTLVQVQEWGKDQSEPPLASVRERVMPMLYPREAWRESFTGFAGTPWVADLTVLYVVDESQSYWYIRDELLDQWGLDREELHVLALENLDDYFERNAMEFTLAGEENGARVLMPNRPDAYNTSRLLSHSFHRKLRDLLGGEFAVGVPSRDFFVAVSLDNKATVEQVRGKVAVDFMNMDHPLTERMLLVGPDGVSEYCPV